VPADAALRRNRDLFFIYATVGRGLRSILQNTPHAVDIIIPRYYNCVIGDIYDRYRLNGKYITFYKAATTDSLPMTYRFVDDQLVISYFCFEPCGIKLKRVD